MECVIPDPSSSDRLRPPQRSNRLIQALTLTISALVTEGCASAVPPARQERPEVAQTSHIGHLGPASVRPPQLPFPPERTNEFTPEQIRRQLDSFGYWWHSEIPLEYSYSFYDTIVAANEVQGHRFMRRALREPTLLKELMVSLYRAYRDSHPPYIANVYERMADFRRFLSGIDLRLEGADTPSLLSLPSVRHLITEVQQQEIREQWQQEVERQTSFSNSAEMREFLHAFDAGINARRLPTREQLIKLQHLVNYVETHFLNRERLLWRSLVAGDQPGQLQKFEASSESIPLDSDMARITRHARVILQDHGIEVRNIRELDAPPESYSRPIAIFAGNQFDFDLPHLLNTLQRFSREYRPLLQGNTLVNFALLSTRIGGRNTAEISRDLNLERHRNFVRSARISEANRERFENFPRALSVLLNERNPAGENAGDKHPATEWIRRIETIRVQRTTPEDQARFLWIARTYARTRIAPAGNLNLNQFAEQLLNTPEYLPITAGPTEDIRAVYRRFGTSAPQYEYDSYLEKNPNIKAIFDFLTLFQDMTSTDDGNPLQTPSNLMIGMLDRAERESLTSSHIFIGDSNTSFPRFFHFTGHQQNIRGVIDTTGPTVGIPRLDFNTDIIREYHRLKQTNSFFQELINSGLINSIPFSQLAHSIFTPSRTSDHRPTPTSSP